MTDREIAAATLAPELIAILRDVIRDWGWTRYAHPNEPDSVKRARLLFKSIGERP